MGGVVSGQKRLKRLERLTRLPNSALGRGFRRTALERGVDHVLKEAAPCLPVGARIHFNGGLGREETGPIEEHTTWNQYPDQIYYRVNNRIIPLQKVREVVSDP